VGAFLRWKEALSAWNDRSQVQFRRLSFGQDDAFDFFKGDGIRISVLGPLLTEKDGVTGLKFLGTPPGGPRIGHESLELDDAGFKGFSASHTINGHSIVFRLRYGAFSYLSCGDLNDEAGRILARKHQKSEISLRSALQGAAPRVGGLFRGVFPDGITGHQCRL
jgi:hypothetical protein